MSIPCVRADASTVKISLAIWFSNLIFLGFALYYTYRFTFSNFLVRWARLYLRIIRKKELVLVICLARIRAQNCVF